MDLLLFFLGAFFVLLGIAGSVLPVIPGPITAWIGILLLYCTKAVPIDYVFLSLTFLVALFIFILDQFISVWGVKKFGGDRKSVIGSVVGLLLGFVFLGPLGLLIGPFLGAFVGGLWGQQTTRESLRSAFGALVGFVTGSVLKFLIAFLYLLFFIKSSWQHAAALF